MKTRFLTSVALGLFFSFSAAAEVLTVLKTPDGLDAQVISEHEPEAGFAVVSLGKLHVEIEGNVYRISHQGFTSFLKQLCEPYRAKYPYTYFNVESRDDGFFGLGREDVVEITSEGLVIESAEEVVITWAFCQSERY